MRDVLQKIRSGASSLSPYLFRVGCVILVGRVTVLSPGDSEMPMGQSHSLPVADKAHPQPGVFLKNTHLIVL